MLLDRHHPRSQGRCLIGAHFAARLTPAQVVKVHYAGWHDFYDEYIKVDRLRAVNAKSGAVLRAPPLTAPQPAHCLREHLQGGR